MLKSHEWLLEQSDEFFSLKKWQKTVDLMSRIFNASAGFVIEYQEDTNFKVTVSSKQSENPYPVGANIPFDTNIFCKHVVLEQKQLYVKNALLDIKWENNPEVTEDGFVSYLGLPITSPDGSLFGTLCVMDFTETNYSEDYLELFKHLREVIEDDLVLIENFSQMREMAMLDSLTNINNRRAFMLLAQQKLKLANRMDLAVSVFFIDINRFKGLNDKYGHEVGDRVLEALATTLLHSLREIDVIGRLGGDEFAVVLYLSEQAHITKITDKIKKHYVEKLQQLNLPKSSISIGHAVSQKKHDLSQLLETADKNMYQDKLNDVVVNEH